MRVALTVLTEQGRKDAVITGDNNVTAGQVATALREAFAPADRLAPVYALPGHQAPPQGNTLWVGGQQVPPDVPAARILRDGVVVTTSAQAAHATALAEPTGVVEIRVIGGPAAGTVHRLGTGAATLGAAPGCQVRLPIPGVPAHACTVTIPARLDAPVLEPAIEQGLLLDGKLVGGTTEWPYGGVLRVGTAVVQLVRPERPDAHLSPGEGGGLAYHRPPRLRNGTQSAGPAVIEVPSEPKRGAYSMGMLLASAGLPLAMGAAMVAFTHEWMFAMFMLMSPVMSVATWLNGRKQQGSGSHRRKMRKYRAEMAELDGRLEAARVADEITRRDEAMDPAQILLTATGPRRRLWERRAEDADTLRLRIGLLDLPARVHLAPAQGMSKDAEMPAVPVAFNVPLSMPLPRLGVVGLAGPLSASRALARWFVAQSAVMQSPRDLSVVVLTADPRAGNEWNWVRWLPHCAATGGQEAVALVGSDQNSATARVAELAAEVSARLARADGGRPVTGLPSAAAEAEDSAASPDLGPKILLVLDGARQLRRIPGMPQILSAARQTGIYAICLDEHERVLPEECAAVLSWDIPGQAQAAGHAAGPGGWTLDQHSAPMIVPPFLIRGRGTLFGQGGPAMLADQVSVAWAERLARALAPIQDMSRDDADSSIPDAARLLDLIHMPDPRPELVQAAWTRRGRTTRVPIGMGADGPFVLDLSADGPHALVAGTTGAGKSELLQTLIGVLAVANRPDAMTFVLIDYKGGSAFKDCARLPHTVGMVSDLDGHLTVRALDSLGAELRRREELLLHAGAKDIEDYWDTRRLEPGLEPIPRLVLIIDEFAAMVAELPDFVQGLIDIARRGRSLGVHLILATQRPAGVVSADIRANTNLRIALRVTSADESSDVIDAPDAAFISKSTPGRCYIRSGAASPVAVQSARIGGRRPESGPAQTPARVIEVGWRELGRALPAGPTGSGSDPTMETDLSVLVDAVVRANDLAGLGTQRRPWLDPLPEGVLLGKLPATHQINADIPPIPYGLVDLPRLQARAPLTLDFPQSGHTVVAGGAQSGRSTLLRTLAGSVASTASPSDVHIYGIDCGAGALLPVSELPHCGAIVAREQGDRVERLLNKLRSEIARRQQLLAAQGFAGIAEQRAAAPTQQRLPWMLLLVDGWEGYLAAFEQLDYGRLVESLLQIMREGSAVGLRAFVTTDRTAMIGQTGTVFSQRMLLRLTDRSDAALADISERALPVQQQPGRLMFAARPNPLEAQIALLDADPAGLAQVAALRRIAEQARARFPQPDREQRPLRVDALPPRITVSQTLDLDKDFAPPSPMWALVGAGGDQLGPQGFDILQDGPGIVVAGPPRSGRSTTLMTMAGSLLRTSTPLLIITPRRSPLREMAGEPGVLAVLEADFDVEFIRSTLNPLERFVVLVDDAEMLHDTPNSAVLERIIVTGRDTERGLILAGTTSDLARCYTGFIPAARKSRSGVLVTVDTPDDGDLFNVRLPRNAAPGPIGRGLIFRPGVVAPLQLACPGG